MGKPKPWLGLDIGGANLKVAMATGFAKEVAFPLWKQPQGLPKALHLLLSDAPPHLGLAVTMTGELADCFATKAEGVAAIVGAVESIAVGCETRYYSQRCSPGDWYDASQAIADWPSVAAANWHALAVAVGELTSSPAIVIDVGSTTTDITPTNDCTGDKVLTDTERLLSGRLLYQGVKRTPLCAAVQRLPYRGMICPVAAELFATVEDVALMLKKTPAGKSSESGIADTADGRPLTKANSIARLARMVCADESEFNTADALMVAKSACEQMELKLCAAIEQVADNESLADESFVLAGSGAWLARGALRRLKILGSAAMLSDHIGKAASSAGPAWALAYLFDRWSQA